MELGVTGSVLPGRAVVLGDFMRFADAFDYGAQRPSGVTAEADLVLHCQHCDLAISRDLAADLAMQGFLVR